LFSSLLVFESKVFIDALLLQLAKISFLLTYRELVLVTQLPAGYGVAVGLKAATCGAVGYRYLDALVVLALFLWEWAKTAEKHAIVTLIFGMPF